MVRGEGLCTAMQITKPMIIHVCIIPQMYFDHLVSMACVNIQKVYRKAHCAPTSPNFDIVSDNTPRETTRPPISTSHPL